jgi:putative nucleotidyltransferase with HDIG domain
MVTTTAEIEELVDSTVSIPTVPRTLMEINRIFSDPNGSGQEAATIISRDPPIAAKVLRLANSSFYGIRSPVSSIQLAISVLGLRVLRNIVVQATVLENLKGGGALGPFNPTWLWDHSFKVATATREICKASTADYQLRPDEAYTCGLLHDVGKILLLDNQRERFGEALERSRKERLPLNKAEADIFGFSHAHVGALLCQRWNLPTKTVAAVMYHHSPGSTPEEFTIGYLISVANAIAHKASDGKGGYTGTMLMPEKAQALGITQKQLDQILEVVKDARPDA